MRYSGADWWAEAIDLSLRAERMRRQFFRYTGAPAAAARWEPPIDLVERGQTLEVTVALPGVEAQRIGVVICGGELIVTAERPAPIGPGVRAVHRLEIPYGRMERRVSLPAGRYRLAEQAVSCGCLRLVLQRIGDNE